ncbi:MAG: ATP-grasp domain-containing protein, partial [Staphylococcus equorum]
MNKHNYIYKMSKVTENCYSYKNNQVTNFYKYGAEELGLVYERNDKIHTFYYKGKKIGEAKGLRALSTSKTAFIICRNKFKTEKLLHNLNVPTLNSELFYESQKKEAFEYVKKHKINSVVLKPLSLAGGKGIELDIRPENFSKAWDRSIDKQKELGVKEPCCAIQPFVDGYDVRIAITEGFFSAALLRVPGHIIGDGKSTIKDLIERKNDIRRKSLYFKKFLYEFNSELINKLEAQNYTLDSVLSIDEILFFSDLGNLTAGAESIDITHLVSKEMIDIALRATAAIPGLYTAGVDILTNDFTSKDGYVSEVNTNA